MYHWQFPEDDYPDWWQNFITDVKFNSKYDYLDMNYYRKLEYLLKKEHGIKMIRKKDRWYLRCGTEAELSAFIFKYI